MSGKQIRWDDKEYGYIVDYIDLFHSLETSLGDYTSGAFDDYDDDVAGLLTNRLEIKLTSKDEVDMKLFEPAMRRFLDNYIRAEGSENVIDFEQLGLIELIVEKAKQNPAEATSKKVPEAMAETIENNMRKTIIDENPVNPKYYERMSQLLAALIEERRKQAIDYQTYLEKIKDLARKVVKPQGDVKNPYPLSIDTAAKRALFDNLGNDEVLASKIDTAIRYTKKADWVGDRFKEREVANAIREESRDYDVNIDHILELAKNQREYQ